MNDSAAEQLLDSPVWTALITGNKALAHGSSLAWRFPPDVAPFGALADRSTAAFEALAALVPPGGRVALHTADPLVPPANFVIDMQAPIIQMLLTRAIPEKPAGPGPLVLGPADVPEMVDLAGRTRPGPFGPRTIEFGRYFGIRVDGALAAMTGERMRFDRFVEVSAVCVDPAHRGKGHAAFLVTWLSHALQEQGLTPFLHVFSSNAGAITLYEKLGFTIRRTFFITSLRAAAPTDKRREPELEPNP